MSHFENMFMKGLNKFPDEYFLKYSEKPVRLKPYDSKQQVIADYYLAKLKEIFKGQDVKLLVRGSTAFKIMGKGEVEVGVYPKAEDWQKTKILLTKAFGEPENIEEGYIRFNDKHDDVEVEIIVLIGHEADVDVKLHKYLINHPETLKEYEEVKKKNCFSKREYQRQKNKFLSEVIERISEV